MLSHGNGINWQRMEWTKFTIGSSLMAQQVWEGILRVTLLLTQAQAQDKVPTKSVEENSEILRTIQANLAFITTCSTDEIRTLRKQIEAAKEQGMNAIKLPEWIGNLVVEASWEGLWDKKWHMIEQTVLLTQLQERLNTIYNGFLFSEHDVKEFITNWGNSKMRKVITALLQDISTASQQYDINWKYLVREDSNRDTTEGITLREFLDFSNEDWENFYRRIIPLNLQRFFEGYPSEYSETISNLKGIVNLAAKAWYDTSFFTTEAWRRAERRIKSRK